MKIHKIESNVVPISTHPKSKPQANTDYWRKIFDGAEYINGFYIKYTTVKPYSNGKWLAWNGRTLYSANNRDDIVRTAQYANQ